MRKVELHQRKIRSSRKEAVTKFKKIVGQIILILLGQIKDTFETNKKLNTFMKVLDYRFIG